LDKVKNFQVCSTAEKLRSNKKTALQGAVFVPIHQLPVVENRVFYLSATGFFFGFNRRQLLDLHCGQEIS